jgi:hypothetical protein
MEVDFDIITVGKALLVLGLAYLLSGLVFLLPNCAFRGIVSTDFSAS